MISAGSDRTVRQPRGAQRLWPITLLGLALASIAGRVDGQTRLPDPAVVHVHASGRPAGTCFSIVVVAEGFRGADMEVFRRSVSTIADRFLHLNPFAALTGLFDIWAIETASVDRYIDLPASVAAAYSGRLGNPVLTPRTVDSYFASTWAGNGGSQKYVSFPNLAGLYAHVGQLLPGFSPSTAELVVITYFPESDGPMERLSTSPLWSPPHRVDAVFFPHEIGHHFGLCDEDYPMDNVTPVVNHTTNTDLADPGHPWHRLFTPRSVVATIVDWRTWNWDSDTWDLRVVNGNSVIVPGLFQTFPPRAGFGDPGAPLRYRPAFSCLMQHTGSRTWLCPVCTEQFARMLHLRAGLSFSAGVFYAGGGRVVIEVPFRASAAGVRVWANGRPLAEVDREVVVADWANIKGIVLADVTPFVALHAANVIRIAGTDTIHLDGLVARNQNGARLPLDALTDLSPAIPDGNTIYGEVFWNLAANGAVEVSLTPDASPRPPRRRLGR